MENEMWSDRWNDSTFDDTGESCSSSMNYGTIFYYCIMSLCFLVGNPAHSWCLWLYLRDGWRIKANQMFQVHYTIIELIGCVMNVFQILTILFSQNETIFTVNHLIFYMYLTGRPLIQTCICIEQYIAVIHPIIFLKYKDIKYKLAGVVTVYLISFSYAAYEINNWEFPDPILNCIYVLTLILMLFCCVSVLCALKTSGPGDKYTNRSTAQEEPNQQKKKAFNIICTNLFITLFIYLPMIAFFIFYQFDFFCIISPILSSMNNIGLLLTPVLRMYKECSEKCLNQRN